MATYPRRLARTKWIIHHELLPCMYRQGGKKLWVQLKQKKFSPPSPKSNSFFHAEFYVRMYHWASFSQKGAPTSPQSPAIAASAECWTKIPQIFSCENTREFSFQSDTYLTITLSSVSCNSRTANKFPQRFFRTQRVNISRKKQIYLIMLVASLMYLHLHQGVGCILTWNIYGKFSCRLTEGPCKDSFRFWNKQHNLAQKGICNASALCYFASKSVKEFRCKKTAKI